MIKYLALVIAFALPAAAQVETGTLRLTTRPQVDVHWDGVALGLTDAQGAMVIEGIPVGSYRLAFARRDLRSLSVEVDVVAGMNTLAVELESAVRSSARTRVLAQEPPEVSSSSGEDGGGPTPGGESDSSVEPRLPLSDQSPGEPVDPPSDIAASAASEAGPGNSAESAAGSAGDGSAREEWLNAKSAAVILAVLLALSIGYWAGRPRRKQRKQRRRRRSTEPSVQRVRVEPSAAAGADGDVIGRVRQRERDLEIRLSGGRREVKDIAAKDAIDVPGEELDS